MAGRVKLSGAEDISLFLPIVLFPYLVQFTVDWRIGIPQIFV